MTKATIHIYRVTKGEFAGCTFKVVDDGSDTLHVCNDTHCTLASKREFDKEAREFGYIKLG